jgi:hypothetical protein
MEKYSKTGPRHLKSFFFFVLNVQPYNPIRGEVFKAYWEIPQDKSVSKFVAEQVSHHPPVSAFYSYNKKKSYILDGHMELKPSFSINTVTTVCEGRQTLNFYKLGEEYTITPAQVAATGMIWGTREFVISGELKVVCKKTGLVVKMTLNHNAVTGSLYTIDKKKKLFTIDGKITENVKVQDTDSKKIYFLFQKNTIKSSPIHTEAPVHKQDENESRRVWHELTLALQKFDFENANSIKAKIENRERAIEDERKKKGEHFVPKLFKKVDKDWVYLNPISTTEKEEEEIISPRSLKNGKLQSFKDFKEGLKLSDEIVKELNSEKEIEEHKVMTEEEFEELKEKVFKIIQKRSSSSVSPRSQKELQELEKQLSGFQLNIELD